MHEISTTSQGSGWVLASYVRVGVFTPSLSRGSTDFMIPATFDYTCVAHSKLVNDTATDVQTYIPTAVANHRICFSICPACNNQGRAKSKSCHNSINRRSDPDSRRS